LGDCKLGGGRGQGAYRNRKKKPPKSRGRGQKSEPKREEKSGKTFWAERNLPQQWHPPKVKIFGNKVNLVKPKETQEDRKKRIPG